MAPELRRVLIAGAIIAAGFALPALAHAHNTKPADASLMTIVRADGSSAQVRNQAPVAPRGQGVIVQNRGVAQSPLAQMNQMMAQMDRQMAMMQAQSRAMRTQSAGQANLGAQNVSAGGAPAGMCIQSMEMTQRAGEAPQVVRRQSGNCGSANSSVAPAPQAAPPQRTAPVAPPQTRSVPRDTI